MITYIHVAPKALAENALDGGKRPAVVVKNQGKVYRCHGIQINGPDGKPLVQVIQNDSNPHDGATRVWIETECEIVMETLEPAQQLPPAQG